MRHVRTAAIAALLTSVAAVSSANTYTVTATADAGAGSLRQAITDANTNPGADTISFNIVGSGVQTIAPASALPAITGPVTIDGYTQPGSSANTNPAGQGLNTALRIEINGTSAGSSPCLSVQADGVTIKGLAINRCTGWDIQTSGAHQNLAVEGCFLGTNAGGTQALSPWGGGIYAAGQQNPRIGGATPAARNLVSGGSNGAAQIILGDGLGDATGTLVAGNLIGTDLTGLVKLVTNGGFINLQNGTNNVIGGTSTAARNVVTGMIILGTGNFGGAGASGNFVRGNFVGTDVTGTLAFGCPLECIRILDKDNTIGGAMAGAGNRIGGAGQGTVSAAILVQASGTTIQGNFIGTDETGTIRLPNRDYGIRVLTGAAVSNVKIGGTGPGEGNVIAYNGGRAGIGIEGASVTGVTVRGNSIFDNPGANATNGLGIDLVQPSTGVTLNDAGDGDAGPNGLQNYPTVSSVIYGASTTTVAGTLNSAPATTFDLDFYADPVCSRRPQDLPEGKTYLGSSQVTTDGSGDSSFNVVLPLAVADGSPITVTATDPGGSTSEFSPRFVLSLTPGSGPAAGGAGTVKGLAFEDGATVTVGGVAATSVVLVDAHTLTIGIPARPAGTINDVFVQNPGGGLSGTLPNGWIAHFNDVPSGNQFYVQVIKLVANQITAGIGTGLYGVGNSTLRRQMAVFLLKSKYGVCYVPPACTGIFPDVPCTPGVGFPDWIEALYAEGITTGCGNGNYCPADPVRRQNMAVFLLKAKHGSSYLPPPCNGDFGDVTCPSAYADWIEQLVTEGITAGCGSGNYCPLNNVTRGQMAAFLVNTFQLP